MNPAVTYEMDYSIFDQEIFFILSIAEKNKIETSENSRQYSIIKAVKETLTI